MPSPSKHEIASELRATVSSLVSAGADEEEVTEVAKDFFKDGTVPAAADAYPNVSEEVDPAVVPGADPAAQKITGREPDQTAAPKSTAKKTTAKKTTKK